MLATDALTLSEYAQFRYKRRCIIDRLLEGNGEALFLRYKDRLDRELYSLIMVSDEDDFSFTNGSSDTAFSLSAWVYVGDVSSDNGPFMSKFNGNTGETEYIFEAPPREARKPVMTSSSINTTP